MTNDIKKNKVKRKQRQDATRAKGPDSASGKGRSESAFANCREPHQVTAPSIPYRPMMITERSFYGAVAEYCFDTFVSAKPTIFKLSDFLQHYHVPCPNEATMKALFWGFQNFVGRGAERDRGALLMDSRDMGECLAGLHSGGFESGVFGAPSIAAFLKSAEAVVATASQDQLKHGRLKIRPLDRVTSRFVEWVGRPPENGSRVTDQRSGLQLPCDFARSLTDGRHRDVAAAVRDTIWWCVKCQLEAAHLIAKGRVIDVDPIAAVDDGGLGLATTDEPGVTDEECLALMNL